jgi:hypothetical protein
MGNAALALSVVAAPAWAAEGDTQLWNTQNFNFKINDTWSANLEFQERWYGDVSYFSFFIVRPSVTYKWNDWLSFTGGYAHFRVWDPDGDFADEDRIWEQANVRLFGGKGEPTLNWRTRLEQRMFEDDGTTTWRLRQQLRLMFPIVERVQGVLSTEAFWRLNTTDRAEQGLEQWRGYAGLNFEINDRLTVEAAYMNVYTWRQSGDTMDHVPWLISTLKF